MKGLKTQINYDNHIKGKKRGNAYSLIATTSTPCTSRALRKTIRPIRPYRHHSHDQNRHWLGRQIYSPNLQNTKPIIDCQSNNPQSKSRPYPLIPTLTDYRRGETYYQTKNILRVRIYVPLFSSFCFQRLGDGRMRAENVAKEERQRPFWPQPVDKVFISC